MRKKNFKDHICIVCDTDFKSVRNFDLTCSRECYNYRNTKKYDDNIRLGIKIDPHNPTPKIILQRLRKL